MRFYTYIIYSSLIDKYYVGETENISDRMVQHNSKFYPNSFTLSAGDWELFLLIQFETRSQARKFETFVKRMKSRKFIESLKSDEIKLNDLLRKFSGSLISNM